MPNRILKESICASESIDPLSAEAEIFFYRLIVNADDYGRFDARPAIIKARCFPLKDPDVYNASLIQSLVDELCAQNLIHLYSADGKKYIQIVTWTEHQQIRAKRSKYPDPSQLPLSDNNGNQMITDDSISHRNPIQSNPIRNPKRNAQMIADASLKSQVITEKETKKDNSQSATLAAIVKAFEDCGGTISTPMIAQQLADIEQEYGSEIVIAALKKASDNGKKGVSILAYCRPIFEQYKNEGIPKNRSPDKTAPGKKVEGVIIEE
jgi:hypothetical protein